MLSQSRAHFTWMKSPAKSVIVSCVAVSSRWKSAKMGLGPEFGPRSIVALGLRLVAVLAFIGLITVTCFRLIAVNATTAGFAYLVGILVLATAWGLVEATLGSVVAMLCFNYFFLPPIGTFSIADPQNWVALIAFLATAITASQLSARAKRRTQEAIDHQSEMERLYALSRAILLTDTGQPVAKQIAHQVAQIFDIPAVALYDRMRGEIYWAGPEDLPEIDDQLRQVAIEGTLLQDEASQVTVTAIRLGSEPIGSIAFRGVLLSDSALQALSNLVAIGLEKVRGQEAASRAEAARQSEELKSTLLDAIAHEFKTPLTSIKAATSSLLSGTVPKVEEQRELVTIVDEEADRLARLVSEAIQMARIEGGKFQLNPQPHSPSSLVAAALEPMKPMTDSREVRALVPSDLPFVSADAELIQLAIRQLIDNALKYSPSTAPVTVSARADPSGVVISVSDQGPGIPEGEQSKIFEKFYRRSKDRHQITGTGMGLAIVREIMHAHGGEISVASSPGQGSEFCLFFPVAPQEKIA